MGSMPISKEDIPGQPSIYRFACPHCNGLVEVRANEINCTIFRHATLKSSGQQISPHAPKDECDKLLASGTINGCAKPFRFDGTAVTICGYI